jgi:[protein-PII] uridylyltransferase
MSATAQKFDIHDPEVIKTFGEMVNTVERLNYLYLLTVADIRATNNNLWNSWRDSLLKQLYHTTKQWLVHHDEVAKNTAEKSQHQQAAALKSLIELSFSEQQIIDLWQDYDPDYFLRHTVDEICWQSACRIQNPTATTLVNSRKHDQENMLEIFICTQDKPRIFAATTACLEQLQLDILDAKISITSDGYALNTYIVNGLNQHQTDITDALERQLNNLGDIKNASSVITPRKMKLFETTPSIQFQTNEQQNHTVMELKTHDRPGLLSSVAQVFLQQDIQLSNAKLITLGDQVEDVFFISTLIGEPLNSVEQNNLQQQLTTALSN